MRAYELADIAGLIKTKGQLHCPLTHKSSSPLWRSARLWLMGPFSVGGFQSVHDLATCGECQANQENMYVCIQARCVLAEQRVVI